MRAFCLLVCAVLAGGCVLNRPDHFHALDSGGAKTLKAQSGFAMQVNLRLSLPVMVDRSEMVLSSPTGITILEHERWAAPLAEQFRTVLGQDIEARRPDVLVASQSISHADSPTTTVAVDVVQLTLQKDSGAKVEARWRVQRADTVSQGREIFVAPASGASYDDLVSSLNICIGLIADRLTAQLAQ